MKKILITSSVAAFVFGAGLQAAQAASDLIGKRVQNTYDVTLYLDPEKALAYALENSKFQRYHIQPRKTLKISYAMDSVEADPKSTAAEPVVLEMASLQLSTLADKNLSEEDQCYEAFTAVLGRLVFSAATARNLEDNQPFHLANVITLDDNKVPGAPGVITCKIPDHGTLFMYARGQVSTK